jgi:hypothetical protein
MRLREPRSALVGLGLIALGASSYSGIERWTSTHIVRPVHMPISLLAGHIRTGSFRLNLKTNYWVVVDPGGMVESRLGLDHEGHRCGAREPGQSLSHHREDHDAPMSARRSTLEPYRLFS